MMVEITNELKEMKNVQIGIRDEVQSLGQRVEIVLETVRNPPNRKIILTPESTPESVINLLSDEETGEVSLVNQSETAEQDAYQSEPVDLDTNQSEIADFDTNQLETADLDTNQSETADLDTNQSETADLDTNQSEIADLDTNQSEIADLDTNQSETADLDTNQSEIDDLDTNQSETADLVVMKETTTADNEGPVRKDPASLYYVDEVE